MARLSAHDLRHLGDLHRHLRTFDGAPIYQRALELTAKLLPGTAMSFWGARAEDDGYTMTFGVAAGFTQPGSEVMRMWGGMVKRAKNGSVLYDWQNVDRHQRNRVLALPSARETLVGADWSRSWPRRRKLDADDVSAQAAAYSRAGIWEARTARVLICDAATALAHFAIFREERPSQRDVHILRQLVEPLRRRLQLERHLQRSWLNEATLAAALAHVPGAAGVVDAAGRPQLLNDACRACSRQEYLALRERFAAAIAGRDPFATVTRLENAGGPRLYLVVLKRQLEAESKRLRARQRWGLSARQTDVLVALAEGRTNSVIASMLGCAERTVEFHVTSLLEKLQVENRASAVARFWAES